MRSRLYCLAVLLVMMGSQLEAAPAFGAACSIAEQLRKLSEESSRNKSVVDYKFVELKANSRVKESRLIGVDGDISLVSIEFDGAAARRPAKIIRIWQDRAGMVHYEAAELVQDGTLRLLRRLTPDEVQSIRMSATAKAIYAKAVHAEAVGAKSSILDQARAAAASQQPVRIKYRETKSGKSVEVDAEISVDEAAEKVMVYLQGGPRNSNERFLAIAINPDEVVSITRIESAPPRPKANANAKPRDSDSGAVPKAQSVRAPSSGAGAQSGKVRSTPPVNPAHRLKIKDQARLAGAGKQPVRIKYRDQTGAVIESETDVIFDEAGGTVEIYLQGSLRDHTRRMMTTRVPPEDVITIERIVSKPPAPKGPVVPKDGKLTYAEYLARHPGLDTVVTKNAWAVKVLELDPYSLPQAVKADWIKKGMSGSSLESALTFELIKDKSLIKSAYKKMSRKYHPDLNGGDPRYDAALKAINEAHVHLTR